MMIERLMIAGVAVVLSGDLVVASTGPAPRPGLFVSNGELMRDGHPYRGVGANYFDLFLRVLNMKSESIGFKSRREGDAVAPYRPAVTEKL